MTLPQAERPLQTLSETVQDALTLSGEEAEELYRYTRYEYLSPNTYPALMKLVARLTARYGPRV